MDDIINDRVPDRFTMGARDESIVDFVELVKGISFKNNNSKHLHDIGLRLYTISEEEYVSVLVESLIDNGMMDHQSMIKGIYSIVDLNAVIKSSIYSEELTKIIIERTIIYSLVVSGFYITTYIDNTIFKDGYPNDVMFVSTMIEELIDQGLISGSDIVYFIDRQKAYKHILSVIVTSVAKTMKESFLSMDIKYNDNMLFMLGWTNNKIHFLEGVTYD